VLTSLCLLRHDMQSVVGLSSIQVYPHTACRRCVIITDRARLDLPMKITSLLAGSPVCVQCSYTGLSLADYGALINIVSKCKQSSLMLSIHFFFVSFWSRLPATYPWRRMCG